MLEEIKRLLLSGYTVRQVLQELARKGVLPLPTEQEVLVIYSQCLKN